MGLIKYTVGIEDIMFCKTLETIVGIVVVVFMGLVAVCILDGCMPLLNYFLHFISDYMLTLGG